MKRPLVAAVFVIAALWSASAALAVEKTVTLAVANMYCAACPYIVKQSLAAVPGVIDVKVSYPKKTAVVTFDDAKTGVQALTDATLEAGYPSEVRQE